MFTLSVNNDLQKFGIEIISADDAGFDTALKQFIGEFEVVIPLVEVAKPLVGFIKNNSSKEVVGINLLWSLFKPNGKKIFATDTGIYSPGVLMGMKCRDPWMVGKTSLINSNELRFFSYFSSELEGTLQNVRSKVKYGRIKYSLTSEEVQESVSYIKYRKNIERERQGVSKYAVSVDGIIFNDGTFVGENKCFSFDVMNGKLHAKRIFLRELRKARSSGKSDSEIIAKLASSLSKTLDSIPEYRPIPPKMRSNDSRFINSKEAYKLGYRNYLKMEKDEIIRRKEIFSDTALIDEYLETEDSDIIDVHREN